MTETTPRYQADKHICVDCRHYQAKNKRSGWCRHEQEAVSGIEGCYGFARIDVDTAKPDRSELLCVDCVFCKPLKRADGTRDYAAGDCSRYNTTMLVGIKECDGFRSFEYLDRDKEAALDASGVQNRQVGGDHYTRHAIQPWDIWAEYNLDPWEASALKYLLRRKGKRLEDLEKCRHCLDYLIARERLGGASSGS